MQKPCLIIMRNQKTDDVLFKKMIGASQYEYGLLEIDADVRRMHLPQRALGDIYKMSESYRSVYVDATDARLSKIRHIGDARELSELILRQATREETAERVAETKQHAHALRYEPKFRGATASDDVQVVEKGNLCVTQSLSEKYEEPVAAIRETFMDMAGQVRAGASVNMLHHEFVVRLAKRLDIKGEAVSKALQSQFVCNSDVDCILPILQVNDRVTLAAKFDGRECDAKMQMPKTVIHFRRPMLIGEDGAVDLCTEYATLL